MKGFLSNSRNRFVLSILIFGGVGLCLFTPELGFMQKSAEFTVHIMLFYLIAGLFFFLFNQKQLMLLSLGACMLLCLFLKQASNSNLVLPIKNSEPSLSIIHVNVTSIDLRSMQLVDFLKKEKVDILSFQEVTPDWEDILNNAFLEIYPNRSMMVRIDPFGMAIYSTRTILSTDTIHYKQVPNLLVELDLGNGHSTTIVSSYLTPPLNKVSGIALKEHLFKLSETINSIQNPVICLGDFNMTYWANDIRQFRHSAGLENSRRDISLPALKIPYEHIFYSNELECTEFEELHDEDLRYIGIKGSYQLRKGGSGIGIYSKR